MHSITGNMFLLGSSHGTAGLVSWRLLVLHPLGRVMSMGFHHAEPPCGHFCQAEGY